MLQLHCHAQFVWGRFLVFLTIFAKIVKVAFKGPSNVMQAILEKLELPVYEHK